MTRALGQLEVGIRVNGHCALLSGRGGWEPHQRGILVHELALHPVRSSASWFHVKLMGSRASNPPIDGRNHAHRSPLCVEVLRQKLEFDGGGGLTGQCKIRFRYSGRIPTTDHSRQKIAEMNSTASQKTHSSLQRPGSPCWRCSHRFGSRWCGRCQTTSPRFPRCSRNHHDQPTGDARHVSSSHPA